MRGHRVRSLLSRPPKFSSPLQAALARWRSDPMLFRREAIILEDGRTLGQAIEDWQREDFQALDDPAHRHAYLERPRGHSKTGDVGVEALKELVLGPRKAQLYCAAADEDQAALLLADVIGKIRRSSLLAPIMKIGRRAVTCTVTGSALTILASDAPSAFGLRPDWIAVDELAEWRRRDLWDSLWTATGKRPRCRVLVISTAGWDRTSIAYEVRQIAEREANWYFSTRGQCASWIAPAWLAQQERSLPRHVFARLHLNEWVEGAGAYLTSAEVDAIFTDVLPTPDLESRPVVGLDLGTTKDRSVAALVRPSGRLLVVEEIATWAPALDAKVDLQAVEDRVATLALTHRARVLADPWQATLMIQRLRARTVDVQEYSFSGDSRRKLFASLLDLVRTHRLRCQPHDDLRRELLSLEVKESSSGWRVDHRPGRHDDHVVAIALAAQALADRPQPIAWQLWSIADVLPGVDTVLPSAEAQRMDEYVRLHRAWFPGDPL
jgi:Terminase large subunit, ATPase domain